MGCSSGKIGYPTKQKAYKTAMALRGPRGRALMLVYKCSECKKYHLTHEKSIAGKHLIIGKKR